MECYVNGSRNAAAGTKAATTAPMAAATGLARRASADPDPADPLAALGAPAVRARVMECQLYLEPFPLLFAVPDRASPG